MQYLLNIFTKYNTNMFNARTLIHKTCQISKNNLSKTFSKIKLAPLTEKIDITVFLCGICACCVYLKNRGCNNGGCGYKKIMNLKKYIY